MPGCRCNVPALAGWWIADWLETYFSRRFAAAQSYFVKSTRFLMERLKKAGELLAPLVFPPICVLCGDLSATESVSGSVGKTDFRSASFCRRCETSLVQSAPMMRSACIQCGWPLPETAAELSCPGCSRRKRAYAFRSVTAVYRYHDVVRQAIIAAKYPRNSAITRELAVRLAIRFREQVAANGEAHAVEATGTKLSELTEPIVTHVPSPFWRQFRRGGVGTGALANRFAGEMNFRCGSVLKTTRSMKKQAWLDDEARRANVRDAFRVRTSWKQRVRGRDFLLVDDVMTTGATADEISRVLLDAGAANVDCLVIARAIRDPH